MVTLEESPKSHTTSEPFCERISIRLKKMVKRTKLIYVLCFLCLIWCLIDSFTPARGKMQPTSISGCDEGVGWCICPREAVCTGNILEMFLLGIARGSVYLVYPLMMALFLSKARHITTFLTRNLYSVYFDLRDTHHIHRVGGLAVEIATWVHVLFHLIRWGIRGEMSLLTGHITGLTGLIAIIAMPLITWPMRFDWLKKKIPFQHRKSMHYLSWVWGLCMVFHAPKTHIFWVMGAVVALYLLDWIIDFHMYTFLVESTVFRKLGTGKGGKSGATLLSFENPKGFELKEASYVLVMLPWVSKQEWHAFSVFPHPTEKNTSSVCMARAGDWTEKLYQSVERPTSRPAWISGPYISPFSSALNYDNLICIATGIGITPAFAVLEKLKEHRRIHLIWLCRDASLLKFFMEQVDLPPTSFVFIFYTGRDTLHLSENVPSNVLIFHDRPKLEKVVTYMIHRVETHELLPEEIVEQGNECRQMSKEERSQNLINMISNDYDPYEFFEAAAVELTEAEIGAPAVPELTRKESPTNLRASTVLISNLGKHNRRASLSNTAPIPSVKDAPNTKTLSRRNLLAKATSRRLGAKGKSTLALEQRLLVDFAVTKESFSNAVHDFFGGVFLEDDVIEHVFDMIDEEGKGYVLESDFMDTLGELSFPVAEDTSHIDDSVHGSVYLSDETNNIHPSSAEHIRLSEFTTNSKNKKKKDRRGSHWSSDEADATVQFVRENSDIVKTWELLYCGGNVHVVKSLKEISKKFKIDLRIEKFDW